MTDLTLITDTSARAVDGAGAGNGVGAGAGGLGAPARDPVAESGKSAGASPAAGVSGRAKVGGGPAAAEVCQASAAAAAMDPFGRADGLLDALVAALRSAGGELLEGRLAMVGRCEARLAAVKTDTVAELARLHGEAHATETVRKQLRCPRGSAKRDVKLAGQLADLPDTAEALAGGTITPRHAQMIADAADEGAVEEAELIDAAERQPTDVFGRTVRDHLNE